MHLLTLLLLMMLLLPTRICHIRFLIEYETFMLCTWLLQTCLLLTVLLLLLMMMSFLPPTSLTPPTSPTSRTFHLTHVSYFAPLGFASVALPSLG